MRVMHVIDSLGRGGAENLVIGLAREMNLNQHETCIVSLSDNIAYIDLVEKYNIRVYCCHFEGTIYKFLAILRASRLLGKIFYEFKPDIINTHAYLSDIITRLTVRNYVPIITTFHTNPPWWKNPRSLVKKIKRRLEKETAHHYTKQFISVSETAKIEAQAHLGIDSAICHVIKNGVNTEHFRPHPNLDFSNPKIIQIARFYPEKNHELSLQAFKLLMLKIPSAKLWFVGDGPEIETIKIMANNLGLQHNVIFLGLCADIRDLLIQCQIFWLTSRVEGLPISLLEAMACGIPPIASAVGDIPKVVQNGDNGFVIEHYNSQAFADRTYELLTNVEKYTSMSAAAAKTVKEQYSIAETAKNYLHTYELTVGT